MYYVCMYKTSMCVDTCLCRNIRGMWFRTRDCAYVCVCIYYMYILCTCILCARVALRCHATLYSCIQQLSNVCTRAYWTFVYRRPSPRGSAILIRGWKGNWFPWRQKTPRSKMSRRNCTTGQRNWNALTKIVDRNKRWKNIFREIQSCF